MLEKGKPADDRAVVDFAGQERRLRDFRRKSHVFLLNEKGPDAWAGKREEIAAQSQRWTWLQLIWTRPAASLPTDRDECLAASPDDLAPGAYLISRWGNVIE